MNDSIELLSSMSPKIKNKLKPGESQFRKGISILALKKNIRRSYIFDKSIKATNNQEMSIERKNSTESVESIECSVIDDKDSNQKDLLDTVCKTLQNYNNPDLVMKSSFSSSNSINFDEEPKKNAKYLTSNNIMKESECLLPKEKLNAISDWLTEVNIEKKKINSTMFSELSTICGNNIGSDYLPKLEEHAVNSTFSKGCNKKFDEMFFQKNKQKIDETASIIADDLVNNSMENLVIEDSFEVLNQSLKTRLKMKDESSREGMKTPERRIKNDFVSKNETDDSDSSVSNETDAANVLDELYGISWRVNKELILSKTEPRKKFKKPSIKTKEVHSESKPKFSLLYKNPYLDTEKSKSQNLLNAVSRSRLKEKKAWTNKLKLLYDSETDSETSLTRAHRKKLQFDDSSDEEDDDRTSKYFKKKTKTKSDSSDKENRNLPVQKDKNKISTDSLSNAGSSGMKSTKCSDEESQVNFVTMRKPTKSRHVDISSDRRSGSSSSVSSTEMPISSKFRLSNDQKRTVRKNQPSKFSSTTSSDSYAEIPEPIISNTDKKLPPANRKIKNAPPSTSSSIPVKIKHKTNFKDAEPTTWKDCDTSSDEEWDKEISRIERKVKNTDGSYSFLASLSENVPISQCEMSARIFRSSFKTNKDQLVKKLFNLYNEKVFDQVLPQNMPVEWKTRLRKSAGFCYCKKITKRTGAIERSASIALSTKVLDRPARLRDTLIHEMCHAATWISNCVSDGHGDYWKAWAFKAMKVFPELPPIGRCHNYTIHTKYTYKCTRCGYSIGRHSKSLDIEKKRCGYCYGKFEILINKTDKNGETKSVAATPKKEATGFALFVKENYGIYKTPNRKHGDVMKILGQKFQAVKIDNK